MIGQFVNKTYKVILVFWIVLTIVMGLFAIRLPSMLEGDGFRYDGEHLQVMEIATQKFGVAADVMLLVFDGVNEEQITTTLDEVDQLGIVSEIISPLEDSSLKKDHFSYAMLNILDEDLDLSAAVSSIRTVVEGKEGITLTGQAAISKDINAASQRDLMIAEAIGLPIAIVVLLYSFGTVVASIVPLLAGVAAVVIALGGLTILAGSYDLSIFVLNIVPMLGLALSIDFSLLFINRYREERKKQNIEAAIRTTIQTAGRAIVFSAFCVFIGLGAMFLINVDIFRDIAIGGMLIVLVAVLGSITLLPSLLIALGDRINRGQVVKLKENHADRWRSFANAVIKRPVLITIGAFILLSVALLPVLKMELSIPQIDSLPTSYESRAAYEKVEEEFGLADRSTAYVVATREDGWESEEAFSQIFELQSMIQSDELVEEAITVFTVTEIESVDQWTQLWDSPMKEEQLLPVWKQFIQDEYLFIPIVMGTSGSSDEAQEWARGFSVDDVSYEVMLGGQAKYNQEIFDEILDRVLLVVVVIMISTFIVLMIAFRSILIPIKAILMNVIGLAATFGILVYIFQFGHLGLSPGTIALIIPVIVFSLVFGLSMDYEVFLISRMQEEYLKTKDNDLATVEGLAVTSKIITSAALIMIVLTGAFAIADVMPVKQIGVGIAIAVAIDASIIRLLLVPSLMKLFGKWNWWMPFRKKEKGAM